MTTMRNSNPTTEVHDMDETQIEETEGFIIIRDGSDSVPQANVEQPVKADRHTEFQTHILAPEYVDGKATGNWRVYFFRDKRHRVPIKPSEIPWDRQFETRVEAEAWISECLKKLGVR